MALTRTEPASPEDKNSHQSLIEIMRCLKYPVSKDGVCEGAAAMAMQTFFARRGNKDRLAPLLKRLDYLQTLDLKYGSEQAAVYLTNIKKTIGNKQQLSDEEQLVVDCFAMMDGILLHLRPELFPELFQRFIVQGQTDIIISYTASIALSKLGLPVQVASIINMFNEDEFNNYITHLNNALTMINEDVVLMFQTATHTIDLMYDAKEGTYCIFDITNCESEDFLNLPFDAENLSAVLFLLFSDDDEYEELDNNTENANLHKKDEPPSIPMQIAIHLCPTKKNLKEILVQNNLFSSLNELADKGKRIGVDDATLAYIAAQNGDVELIRMLIKCGIKLDIPLKGDGSTVAYIAAHNNHAAIIKELTGVNLNATTQKGFTPAFVAAQYNYVEALIALKSIGANLDLQNENSIGLTPLMVAAMYNRLEALKTLIKLEVNLDSLDNEGCSALFHAVANNQTQAALLLIQSGARLDLGDKERVTPLLLAAMNGNQTIVEACLKAGADLFSHSKSHNNLAHYAARTNNVTLLNFLIQVNFPLENKTDSGFTPLDFAVYNKHVEAVRVILPQVNPSLETLHKLQRLTSDSQTITSLIDEKIKNITATESSEMNVKHGGGKRKTMR